MAGENSQFNLLLNIIGNVSGNFKKALGSSAEAISKTQEEAVKLSESLSSQNKYLSNLKKQISYEKSMGKFANIGKKDRAELNEGYKEQVRDVQSSIRATRNSLSATNERLKIQKKEAQTVTKSIQKRMSEQQKLTSYNENAFNKVHSNALKEMKSMENLELRNQTVSKLMKKTGLSANSLARGMKRVGYSISNTGEILDSFGNKAKLTRKDYKGIIKASRRFEMSNLSGMFAMMAVQRVMRGFLTSAINTYKKVNEEGGAFTEQTNKLSAAWEFFKYSLLEALGNSEIFQKIVGFLVEMVNKFNSLSEAQKSMIGLVAFAILLASTIGMIIFQIELFATSFGITFGAAALILFGIIIIFAGLILVIKGIIEIQRAWGEDWKAVALGIIKVIQGIALVVAGVALIMGGWIVGLVAVAVWAVLEIAKWAIENWDKIKEGWVVMVSSLKAIWVYFKYFFKEVIDSIVSFGIDAFSTFALKAAKIMDKLGLDGLADKVRKGIDALKSANDEKLANVEEAKNKELAAIIVERDAKIQAIRDAQKVQEQALKSESNVAQKSQGVLTSHLGLDKIGGFMGYPDASAVTSSAGNQSVVDNSINNISPTINIEGTGLDADEIANQVMERLNDIYSQEVGSSNGK